MHKNYNYMYDHLYDQRSKGLFCHQYMPLRILNNTRVIMNNETKQ